MTFASLPARAAIAIILPVLLLSQAASDPWTASEILEPAALARTIGQPHPPLVISVAFPVLYRNKHILHALDAGAGSSPEGIAALKRLVAHTPKGAEIVIYCGCCPMTKCPNVRPAYRALKDLGFERIGVLDIPVNMHTDWYAKDYPSELGERR